MDGAEGKDTNKGKMGGSGMYRPSGVLQGDTGGMPNKGTETGLNGDTYGADLGQSATNCIGGMRGTDSDGMEAA